MYNGRTEHKHDSNRGNLHALISRKIQLFQQET